MSERRAAGTTVVLVCSLLLVVIAFGLSIAGLLSPSWQVVSIKEFRAEHHHGLWLDCTRPEVQYAVFRGVAEGMPLHCTYKFDASASQVIDENIGDVDENSAAGESEHHQFFGWHKVVLICFVFSLLFALLSLCSGLCAPCNGACSIIYAVLVFLAFFFSIVGDAVFFFAAHRVDNRFVQGLVGTYEQEIGHAFALHGAGSGLFLLAWLVSIVASYKLVRSSSERPGLPLKELAPLYGSRMRH
ncbi:unnamed protein product, partial [Mesorhabditis belari]|uniref:Clc-like protein n=1 Tax=Mesorhabditis belari TaxID=2138241 RepID=A0AAF3EE73_9BILA